MGPGGRDSAIRWLPELPPAMKIPSAASEPGAGSQLQVTHTSMLQWSFKDIPDNNPSHLPFRACHASLLALQAGAGQQELGRGGRFW